MAQRLKNLTPMHLRCSIGACPAVLEAGGDLLIIGKNPSPELLAEIEGRVGEDEYAIVISKAYFAVATNERIAELEEALKPFDEIVENWHREREQHNAGVPAPLRLSIPADDDHVCVVSMTAKDLYALVATAKRSGEGAPAL